MANLTLRSIPDTVLDQLRALAVAKRRSLNGEILVLIEDSLEREAGETRQGAHPMNAATQVRLWEALCGRWKDKRDWGKIADDIVSRRTAGRQVTL